MKLVFDDGTEQEIVEKDFKQIIRYANRQAHETENGFREDAERTADKGDYVLSLSYLKWASRAHDIATITHNIKMLYF